MDDPTRDPYLAALDQTALRLLERLDPRGAPARRSSTAPRACSAVKHGFLYLLEGNDGGQELVVPASASGCSTASTAIGCRTGRASAGRSSGSGRPMNVDDYGAYPNRGATGSTRRRSAPCARVPLTSDGEVLGVIGLASGDRTAAVQRPRARGARRGSPSWRRSPSTTPACSSVPRPRSAARPRRPPRPAHGAAQPDAPADRMAEHARRRAAASDGTARGRGSR